MGWIPKLEVHQVVKYLLVETCSMCDGIAVLSDVSNIVFAIFLLNTITHTEPQYNCIISALKARYIRNQLHGVFDNTSKGAKFIHIDNIFTATGSGKEEWKQSDERKLENYWRHCSV